MDRGSLTERLSDCFRKYRYVLLVVLAGICLMSFPEKRAEEIPREETRENVSGQMDLEESLAQILSTMEGAGKVEVLLTESAGERILYQMNEDTTSRPDAQELRSDTVLVAGNDRQEAGLVRQIIPPTYLGAVIVCQGADQAAVRLSIVEAVMGVTGLTSDKITVLKMK